MEPKARVLSARRVAADAAKTRHAALCVGPRYPGKPEDYAYVASEYCRKRSSGSRSTTSPTKTNRASLTREISELTEEIERREKQPLERLGRGRQFAVVMVEIDHVVGNMLSARWRREHPKPIARLRAVMDDYEAEVLRKTGGKEKLQMRSMELATLRLVRTGLQAQVDDTARATDA